MISVAAGLFVLLIAFGAIAIVAAAIAAVLRRWAIFRKLAAAIALAIAGLIPVWGLVFFGAMSLGDTSAESKATMLARGISEGMNAGVYATIALLLALPVWALVKRRVRKTR